MERTVDVAVIGGGINGCACAADAALRGLSTALVEKGDLASATSSKSTKLIHGGLRYLELGEFQLVRRALKERARLMQLAPHLIKPLSIVIPLNKNTRPQWLMRAGLFIYDRLGGPGKLPTSKKLHPDTSPECFAPLQTRCKSLLQYHDATTDDARLTVSYALMAHLSGASILTHTSLVRAHVINGLWHLTLQHAEGDFRKIVARALINATGPWAKTTDTLLGIDAPWQLTPVQGSHVLFPKLYEGEHAYLLQNPDKRVVFVVPWYGFTMVGTTDTPYNGSLDAVQITEAEKNYLCTTINRFFKLTVTPQNICDSFSGVRPLVASSKQDARTLSRDYVCHFTDAPAPGVSIYGGKLTTCRELAEIAVDALKPVFPDLSPSKTAVTPLPGAEWFGKPFSEYVEYAHKRYAWLNPELLNRYLGSYGTRTEHLLGGKSSIQALGSEIIPGLYQAELDYLIREEWVRHVDDVLWRRTKLGLTTDRTGAQRVAACIESSIALI